MNEGLYASWLGLAGHSARGRDASRSSATCARAADRRRLPRRQDLDRASAAAVVARAKADGANVTAGVSINHLSLNENDVGEYRTFFQLSPPLRAEDDRLAMVEALRDGTIDIIVSSHDPQDVDTKRLPFADAADGAIGLETLLGAALRLYHNGDVPLLRAGRGAVHARRRDCSACRAARCSRARRPTSPSSTSTSRGSCSEGGHPLALEEHLLRGRAAAGQGLANAGCGPHSVFS